MRDELTFEGHARVAGHHGNAGSKDSAAVSDLGGDMRDFEAIGLTGSDLATEAAKGVDKE